MPAPYLDTNIIIRFITQDDPGLAQKAGAILRQCDLGTGLVELTEGVLVEAVQVLSSKRLYNLPRSDVQFHLTNVISLRGVKLRPKVAYLQALALYAATNLDFVNVLLAIKSRRGSQGKVVSFDGGFDKLPGITRMETL